MPLNVHPRIDAHAWLPSMDSENDDPNVDGDKKEHKDGVIVSNQEEVLWLGV